MTVHPFRTAFVLLAAVCLGPAAFAQASAPSPSREEVKAETKAAAKAGQLAPAGPGGTVEQRMAPPPKSTKTRAERKAETRKAVEGKQMTPAGEGPGSK